MDSFAYAKGKLKIDFFPYISLSRSLSFSLSLSLFCALSIRFTTLYNINHVWILLDTAIDQLRFVERRRNNAQRCHLPCTMVNCPVCLRRRSTWTRLPCGHVGCAACVYRAVRLDPRCFLCRRSAHIVDLVDIDRHPDEVAEEAARAAAEAEAVAAAEAEAVAGAGAEAETEAGAVGGADEGAEADVGAIAEADVGAGAEAGAGASAAAGAEGGASGSSSAGIERLFSSMPGLVSTDSDGSSVGSVQGRILRERDSNLNDQLAWAYMYQLKQQDCVNVAYQFNLVTHQLTNTIRSLLNILYWSDTRSIEELFRRFGGGDNFELSGEERGFLFEQTLDEWDPFRQRNEHGIRRDIPESMSYAWAGHENERNVNRSIFFNERATLNARVRGSRQENQSYSVVSDRLVASAGPSPPVIAPGASSLPLPLPFSPEDRRDYTLPRDARQPRPQQQQQDLREVLDERRQRDNSNRRSTSRGRVDNRNRQRRQRQQQRRLQQINQEQLERSQLHQHLQRQDELDRMRNRNQQPRQSASREPAYVRHDDGYREYPSDITWEPLLEIVDLPTPDTPRFPHENIAVEAV